MSKHYTRWNAKRDHAIARLRDAYSSAQSFGQSHADLLVAIDHARAPLKGAPEWARAYFSGYQKALADGLYVSALVYGGIVNGRLYTTHSARADYYGKHGISPGEWATGGQVTNTGHYWAPETVNMVVKPFFVGEA